MIQPLLINNYALAKIDKTAYPFRAPSVSEVTIMTEELIDKSRFSKPCMLSYT